jgi:hypothetical protein
LNFEFIVFRRHRAQKLRFCFQPVIQVMTGLAASLFVDRVGATRDVFSPEFIWVGSFASSGSPDFASSVMHIQFLFILGSPSFDAVCWHDLFLLD